MVTPQFWSGRRVLITGHTGFKGGWLSLWLKRMGAQLDGYALPAAQSPSLYAVAQVERAIRTTHGDVRDLAALREALQRAQPEVVFHMAAQSLVRPSYEDPVATYATNVLGTVHLLEAIRATASIRAVVVVTSDKCYENREWPWGYREDEPMGGFDPYSNSKGCAELVTAAYRNSFFSADRYQTHGVAIASARAGNVIGGGDWSRDRLIPDFVRAVVAGEELLVRSPHAIRPWQHVLEPLSGYLVLAQRLITAGPEFSGGWNFGPHDVDARPVAWIAENLTRLWGERSRWRVEGGEHPHEAHYLKLDISKARARLNWSPRWTLTQALTNVVDWYRAHRDSRDMLSVCESQIQDYERSGVQ